MPSTSLITSSRSSCTFHHSCCGSVLLSRTDHLLENPTMDHPLMHRRRAPSSSVFSFEAAAAAVKVVKEEEDYSYSTEEEGEEEDDEGGELEAEESYPKTKRMNLGGGSGKKGSSTAGGGGGGGVTAVAPLPPGCQVDKCKADLTGCKRYHQRHKVCEYHAKAQVVIVAGLRQRFCQQCSRFHGLSEFDDAKRSCRRRLAGHNERRRKHFSESHGEGAAAGRRESAARIKKNQCRQAGESGRTPMGFV